MPISPKLSHCGKAYVGLVVAVGAGLLLNALVELSAGQVSPLWLLLAGLTLVSGRLSIRLPSTHATISVAETFIFSSVLLFGVAPAILTSALDAFVASRTGRSSRNAYRASFNVAESTLSVWVVATLFYSLTGVEPLFGRPVPVAPLLLPLLLMTTLFFALNGALQLLAVWFERDVVPQRLIAEYLPHLALTYFTTLCFVVLLVVNVDNLRFGVVGVLAPLTVLYYVSSRLTHDKRATESALRESEARVGELSRQVTDVPWMIVADVDRPFTRVNRAFTKTLGWSEAELLSRSFLDLVHPEDRASTMARVQTLEGDGEEVAYFESRCRCRDGSWKWLAWTCSATPEGSRYFYAVARDISRERHTDEALRFRDSVFESMELGLLIADVTQPDHPIVYCNPAAVRITGYSEAELIGRNSRFLQKNDRHQIPLAELRSAVAQGRATRIVLRNYRKNGELFWNELTLSPVHDSAGRVTHFVGLQHDFTEIVMAERSRWSRLAGRINNLAPRQKQVLDGLVAGKNIKTVAHELGIAQKTAEMHRRRVLEKMDVGSVVELVRLVLTSAPGSETPSEYLPVPPRVSETLRGGPRNSDRLLRWDPDHREGVWNVPKETELPG